MHLLAMPKAPPQFVEAFCAGMPSSYWVRHDHAVIREHAEIVWRRGTSLAHVELRPTRDGAAAWVSVVTDDRPGLLSLLTAALSAHSLDIVSAKIYCRSTGAPVDEAVDFFLVRPLSGASGLPWRDESYVNDIRRLILALLSGETDLPSVARRLQPTSRPPRSPPAEVYFDERSCETDRLTVDTDDRPGLLLAITAALFHEEIRILGSEVLTVAGRVHDEFDVLDVDGSRLTAARKSIIVARVVAALAAAG